MANLPPDEYLEPAQLAELHGMLREQLANLLQQGRETVKEVTEVKTQEADELDVAINESNREFQLRMADRERKLITKIQKSLARIQEGEYGTCESCGAPITYKRLLARPVASQCIDCKTEAEQLETKRRVF